MKKNLFVQYVVTFMKEKLHQKSAHCVKLQLLSSEKWKNLKKVLVFSLLTNMLSV